MQETGHTVGRITQLTHAGREHKHVRRETGTCTRCKRSWFADHLHAIGQTDLLLCDDCLEEVFG